MRRATGIRSAGSPRPTPYAIQQALGLSQLNARTVRTAAGAKYLAIHLSAGYTGPSPNAGHGLALNLRELNTASVRFTAGADWPLPGFHNNNTNHT